MYTASSGVASPPAAFQYNIAVFTENGVYVTMFTRTPTASEVNGSSINATIRISGLSPGIYQFAVQSSNPFGVSQFTARSMNIIVSSEFMCFCMNILLVVLACMGKD